MTDTRSVLVVDDDPIVRRILGSILERGGYTVVRASDGREGWAVLQRRPLDVVITDRAMPGMDGLELIRNMRSSAAHAKIPIIMLTGSVAEAAAQEAGNEGADAFLTKLVSSQELLSTVERVLKDAEPRPPLSSSPTTHSS
jgi:CheY-like chemotaxis protein